MPFKSEAQRKWMWANHPEMAKHWQSVTPKGKKLPEHVKQAAFLDELSIIMKEAEEVEAPHGGDIGPDVEKGSGAIPAGPLGNDSPAKEAGERGIGDWISEHPVATGLGAASLGAGGVLGRRLLTKAAPARGIVKKLRPLARKEGIRYLTPKTLRNKIVASLTMSGAAKPIWTDARRNVLKGQKGVMAKGRLKGVTMGAEPGYDKSLAELELGGGGTGARGKVISRNQMKLERGGKVMEGSKEMGISQHMARGSSMKEVMKKYNLAPPSNRASREVKAEFFSKLQKVLRKEYGRKGFFLKPHMVEAQAGAFPSEKGNWGKLYKGYLAKLKKPLEERAKQLERADSLVNPRLRSEFGENPHYTGRFLDPALKQLSKTRIEQKMDLLRNRITGKPIEYRTHIVRGAVPKELSHNRWFVPPLRGQASAGSPEGAATWVRKNIVPKLPKQYSKGTLGLDVARARRPDGKYVYKVIEMNPSSTSGSSGFLDPTLFPPAAHDMYKWIHGVESPTVTGLKALGTAGLAGGGGVVGSKLLRHPQKGEG